jgi:hypothetical protein
MGKGVVWCGNGAIFRLFLRPGRIWLQSKADRQGPRGKRGLCLAFPPTFFCDCGRNRLIAQTGKIHPEMAKFTPKGVIRGPTVAKISKSSKLRLEVDNSL